MEPDAIIDQYLDAKRGIRASIDGKNSALLIIDMQEYQVRENSAIAKFFGSFAPGIFDYYAKRVESLVEPNLVRLMDFFHENKLPVILTRYASFRPDKKDYPPHIQMFNALSESTIHEPIFPDQSHPSTRIVPKLEVKQTPSDIVLLKTTSCAFTSTDLDHTLRNLNVSTVFIGGVVTNFCVESAARIASDLGFRAIIIDDASAAWAPSLHAASLRTFEMLYGDVMTTDAIIKQVMKSLKKSTKAEK
nr:isochorismatase family cysteine hydrolase [Candidatus Sigynarchaeota archaeon]